MRRRPQGQEVEPNVPIPPTVSKATPPWESERPVTSRRTARLTFTVYGRTYDEINRLAGEEVERITGHNLAGWDVGIDARAVQATLNSDIRYYSAEVTVSRTGSGGHRYHLVDEQFQSPADMPTTVFGDARTDG